jgi:hypothetical protein
METKDSQLTSVNEKFNSKYADQIRDKNFYNLLLKVKTDLRKSVKKDINEFFNLFIWSMEVLKLNSENESLETLMIYTLDEYEKHYNKNDMTLFLNNLASGFNFLPDVYDKTKIKHRILKFIETKGIPEISILNIGLFKYFAYDSLKNKDTIEGLRYALKSQDINVIHDYVETFSHKFIKEKLEYNFFVSRVCLEILLMKNLVLSLKFIKKYIDTSNNLQNNHPILNFAYLLTSLLIKDVTNFNYFWTFINLYRPIVSLDHAFPKYLNKVSITFYGQEIIKEDQGMNIMNLLKAFAN